MTSQIPQRRQLSSRSVESLLQEKRELVAFIRDRRAYLLEQEQLIEIVINNGNNALFQLTAESDALKLENLIVKRENIALKTLRDNLRFEIAVLSGNI